MGDEDIRSLLRKNLELTKENNRLLKKMRRAAMYATIFRLIWFAIIIGVPLALYYYVLDPYIGELSQTYQEVRTSVENVNNTIGDIPLVGDFLQNRGNETSGE